MTVKTELIIHKTFTKAFLVDAILRRGELAGVMFDHHAEGVIIHASLRATEPAGGSYMFLLSLDAANPIPSIRLDLDGVRAVLSVKGMSEPAFVPWAAIFAILSPRGIVYVDDAPPRVVAAQAAMKKAVEAKQADFAKVLAQVNGAGGDA